jgi:hypothetical protein
MNYLGVHLAPELLEESWRELERQRDRERRIKEARVAQRAARPSRFATFTAWLASRRGTPRPAVEPC